MTRNEMLKRFHDLVIQEALGTPDPKDAGKLERYQSLLREKPSRKELRMRRITEYQLRLFRRVMGAMSHQVDLPQKAVDLLNSRFWDLV